jgi:hypothetical protein
MWHQAKKPVVFSRGVWLIALQTFVLACGSTGRSYSAGPTPGHAASAAFVPADVAKLTGPLTDMGSPESPLVREYDQNLLSQGRYQADNYPLQPDALYESSYYDPGFVIYQVYYRTADSYWLDQARRMAEIWRDSPENANIRRTIDVGDYGYSVPSPRGFSTLGLAVYALETGDPGARTAVDYQARLVERDYAVYEDIRESGWGLMALVASTLLGDDHRPAALSLLDSILSNQKPDGRWEQYWSGGAPPGCPDPYTMNFMVGILMEGLVIYDRVIGDGRILPALQNAMAWLWDTQWVASAGGFQYTPHPDPDGHCGLGTDPAASLNGLFLAAGGYVYERTGDLLRYHQQGTAILWGLTNSLYAVLDGRSKIFAQVYRSSMQFIGYSGGFYAVSASPGVVAQGDPITGSWRAPAAVGSSGDSIRLYAIHGTAALDERQLGGGVSGTVSFPAPQAGAYELRYLPSNGYAGEVSGAVLVHGAYTLTATPTTVAPGDYITVYWTAPTGRDTSGDYVQMFDGGDNALDWMYGDGTHAGSLFFVAAGPSGTRTFRYFPDGSDWVKESNPVTVSN